MSSLGSVSSNITSGISSIGDSAKSLTTSTTSAVSSIGQSMGETAKSVVSSNNNGGFSSLFTSNSSTGQVENTFWNSSLLLSVIGLILFIFIIGNIYMYATTGKALFMEELFDGMSSVTSGIKTFFGNLMNNTELGGKGIVEVAGETIKSITSIPDQIVKGNQDNKSSNPTKDAEEVGNADSKQPTQNSLQTKIDRPAVTNTNQQPQRPQEINYSGPEPNENSKGAGGSSIGFCYIGEYDGTRSCASVNDPSTCMSGDIFDSKEKCMNPSAYA